MKTMIYKGILLRWGTGASHIQADHLYCGCTQAHSRLVSSSVLVTQFFLKSALSVSIPQP